MVKESRVWHRVVPCSASFNNNENLMEIVAALLGEDR